jgi:NDP-sugar pyrophosphorylase family protein
MPETSRPDAIVLCGGAGTRLRSVTGESPKSMASVAGRPFLELLLRQLRRYGFERVILAVGYRSEVIASLLGDSACGLQIAYARETTPLGTGGALRNAAHLMHTDAALVMNGDSYTDVDVSAFLAQHAATHADLFFVVTPADGRDDTGSVFADPDGKLLRFTEKERPAGGQPFNNAGVYLLSQQLILSVPEGIPTSLEKELFPKWIDENRDLRVFVHHGDCVDIGTPVRFEVAQQLLAAAEMESPTTIAAGNSKEAS